MPAVHSVSCFDVQYGSAQAAAASATEHNRRVGSVENHTQAASAGGHSLLQRKTPLVQRKAYFDSAEYFMAKEQGSTVVPLVGLPRAEPARRANSRQPSRLSISSH